MTESSITWPSSVAIIGSCDFWVVQCHSAEGSYLSREKVCAERFCLECLQLLLMLTEHGFDCHCTCTLLYIVVALVWLLIVVVIDRLASAFTWLCLFDLSTFVVILVAQQHSCFLFPFVCFVYFQQYPWASSLSVCLILSFLISTFSCTHTHLLTFALSFSFPYHHFFFAFY